MKYDFNALVGCTIEFNKEIERCENDFDPNQKAKVIGVRIQNSDEVVQLQLDFSEFAEENKKFATYNYYDTNGSPALAYHETNSYPKDFKDTIYIDMDVEKYPLPFNIVKASRPTTQECLDFIARIMPKIENQYPNDAHDYYMVINVNLKKDIEEFLKRA